MHDILILLAMPFIVVSLTIVGIACVGILDRWSDQRRKQGTSSRRK